MNTGQQTTRRLASKAGQSICRSCRDTISRNSYATAATAAAVQTDQQTAQHIPPVAAVSPAISYAVNAGVVLSRPPQITRDLHPLESAFFLYQRRLNERLAMPFTRYFYFKKRTPADLEWKRKMKQRLTPARDIGRYKGYGDEAWNDEVLVGAPESQLQWQVDRLLDDADSTGITLPAEGESASAEETAAAAAAATATTGRLKKKVEHEPVERPMSRITEADSKGDVKSLNRALQRTLYLLVKDKSGQWAFPSDLVTKKETLAMAAERILTQAGGINMNTWVVGNAPIGVRQNDYLPEALKKSKTPHQIGSKTFFVKARIMAGQADLKENPLGYTDFKWLAKNEIEKEVEELYWRSIKNMLAER
ncbi:50S ribosomal subunit L30 [Dendryphion nanum]|uniref:Large ribosomal subunit protein mL46 n=1 Tax=Dendryphion nanum TaxID=256645 RepID=A0A9P9DFK7_9PLEO|nr:50S ribosomal subunit L30 [Dendryphion nanum]